MSKSTRRIWLARDDDGEIYAFPAEPKLFDGSIWDDDTADAIVLGGDDDLPEVTFENSPVKATVEEWYDNLKIKDITLE